MNQDAEIDTLKAQGYRFVTIDEMRAAHPRKIAS
jgi:hypothetical protein